MYNSVDFRIFPNVVQITPLSNSRTFPSPLKETSDPLAVSPTFPLPHLQAIINLFFKYIYFIIYLAALGLRCCARAFSSCGERGLLFLAVCGLLIVVASLVAEHGL